MQKSYGEKAVVNREGKPMMFLIRTSFWLLVLILLLPTDENQQKRIYGTAQAAVNDLVGFCDRNPQTCVRSQEAFEMLVQKAKYGAQMVMNLVDEQTTAAVHNTGSESFGIAQPVPMPSDGRVMEGSVMPVPAAPLEPMTWDASTSQDTLNPDDRVTAWDGPGI